MGNTENFNFYKPEQTDPYNVVGYGFGPDDTFENLILSALKDDSVDVLTKQHYAEILGNFAQKINLLDNCLDKTRITNVISDSDTTHAINSQKIYQLKDETEGVEKDLNGNESIDDKIFIKLTEDITNNTNDVFKLNCNGLDYYFYSNSSGEIFYKDKLNNGSDVFTDRILFKGKNIVKYFSEFYGQEMYYSVYDNKVYVADDVFSEQVTMLDANGTSNHFIKEVNGALFLLKTDSSGLHDIEYSTDGHTFRMLNLPSVFDVDDANVFYVREIMTFFISNDNGYYVKLSNGMATQTLVNSNITIGNGTATRETKLFYNGKNIYSIATYNGNKVLVKYDFANDVNEVDCILPFNTTANFTECGGGIFYLKEKDFYVYCPTIKTFKKIYYFTQNNASSKIESNENGISFNKLNNSPAVKYYLWKENVYSLRDLIEQFGDSVVEH